MATDQVGKHAAEASALGFYYQSLYALLTLLAQDTDDAAIGVEQLDDVVLKANGETLLLQLKHSISTVPAPVTLKSRPLWQTIKVWIDAMPLVTLAETTFQLVTVGGLDDKGPLKVLLSRDADRAELRAALIEEAQRVVEERDIAAKAKKKALPHSDRVDGCQAFLSLSETMQLNLLRRTRVRPDSTPIDNIESSVAGHLGILLPDQRAGVARRLVQWWDREIVYSLCGKRARVISRSELQQAISLIVSDIEHEKLMPDFETATQPKDYQPDGMLTRQIRLVNGGSSDLSRAIREEWRARSQRSKWINEKLSMATVIVEYDRVLHEYWSDQHQQMAEGCASMDDAAKSALGLKLLRWTHENAPAVVRPITDGWSAAYYVRGSYQVLAINLEVGWHPDFASLLGATT